MKALMPDFLSHEKKSKRNSLTRTTDKKCWQRGLVWLVFLGPLFFVTYGLANEYASQQTDIGHIVFNWEQHIPFIPWTIIPYWSIDLLYILSLLVCTNKQELDNHGRRLLTAQLIAVACFMLFPLEFSSIRPATEGLPGLLFDVLSGFDQPYNQAPSLHIALLIILWVHFPRHLSKILRLPFHVLCVLIALSVLTTWQHHFIDVPTGLLLGWFSIWLWPEQRPSMLAIKKYRVYDRKHLRIAGYYLSAALFMMWMALVVKGWGLWLLWPALSLFMVSLFYALIGPEGFQKNRDGSMSLASQWLLMPYLLAVRINAFFWTARNCYSAVMIRDGVSLGRFPSRQEMHKYHTIIDLTAEIKSSQQHKKNTALHWYSIPGLDLLMPDLKSLNRASDRIEQHVRTYQGNKPLLVCCALGYSRSAMVVLFWLVKSGRINNYKDALNLLKCKRPEIVIDKSFVPRVQAYFSNSMSFGQYQKDY